MEYITLNIGWCRVAEVKEIGSGSINTMILYRLSTFYAETQGGYISYLVHACWWHNIDFYIDDFWDHVLVGASPSAASYHMIMILHNFHKILQHQHATSLNNHAYNKRTTKTIQHQHPASLRETCGRRKKEGTEGNFRSSWLLDSYPGATYDVDLNYRYTLPETNSQSPPKIGKLPKGNSNHHFFRFRGGKIFCLPFQFPSTSRPFFPGWSLLQDTPPSRHRYGTCWQPQRRYPRRYLHWRSLKSSQIDSDPQRDHRKWHQSQTRWKDQAQSPGPQAWITKPPWPTRNRKSQFGWRMGKCGETEHNDPMSQDHHDPHTSQTFAGAADEELADRWH